MARKTPAFPLGLVQELVAEGRVRITNSAIDGAARLELERSDIIACVLALSWRDYYKTLDSTREPGTRQDVYLTRYGMLRIYLKLRLDEGVWVIVISFKQDESTYEGSLP